MSLILPEELSDSTHTLFEEMEAQTAMHYQKNKALTDPVFEIIKAREQVLLIQIRETNKKREAERETEREKERKSLPGRFALWIESADLSCKMGALIIKESEMYSLKSEIARIVGPKCSAESTKVSDLIREYKDHAARIGIAHSSNHDCFKLKHQLDLYSAVVHEGIEWCKLRVQSDKVYTRRRREVCEIKILMTMNQGKRDELARIQKNISFLEKMVRDGRGLVIRRELALKKLEDVLLIFSLKRDALWKMVIEKKQGVLSEKRRLYSEDVEAKRILMEDCVNGATIKAIESGPTTKDGVLFAMYILWLLRFWFWIGF